MPAFIFYNIFKHIKMSADLFSIVSLAQTVKINLSTYLSGINWKKKPLFNLAVCRRKQFSIRHLRHFALRSAFLAALFLKYLANGAGYSAARSNLLKSNLFNYACLCCCFKRPTVAVAVAVAVSMWPTVNNLLNVLCKSVKTSEKN